MRLVNTIITEMTRATKPMVLIKESHFDNFYLNDL